MKLRHSSNSSIHYLFPANAIPGLITTVSQRGFPAVEHFSTCTLGPTKVTVSLIILFLTERGTTRSVCLQIKKLTNEQKELNFFPRFSEVTLNVEIPSKPSKLHQSNPSFTSSQDNVHGIAMFAAGYLDGLSVAKTGKNIAIQYWEHLTLLYCNHSTSAPFFKKSIRLFGLRS